jgi:cytochrome c-type biogenesis protein CcmH
MGWLLAIGLALAAFAAIAWLTGWRRAGWEAVGAALILGVAGYATQAHPGLAGAPKQAAESMAGDGSVLVAERSALSGKAGLPGNTYLLIADGYTRNGQFADAAGVLRIAVEKQPGNSEAWLALANVLVAHAEGTLSPAALHAYRRAAEAGPDQPGPPYFLGLALAQAGRFGEARAIWAGLLERGPKDAPWRADLAEKLARLDALIARQGAAGTGQ